MDLRVAHGALSTRRDATHRRVGGPTVALLPALERAAPGAAGARHGHRNGGAPWVWKEMDGGARGGGWMSKKQPEKEGNRGKGV